jgi:hypothetical protein
MISVGRSETRSIPEASARRPSAPHLVAILVWCGLALAAACSGDERARRPSFDLPLSSARELFLDRWGADSYVGFPEGTADGPALYWRQYSDFLSHFGMYRALFDPLLGVTTGQPCTLESYRWRAALVERACRCGDLRVNEVFAYVDARTIAALLQLENTGGATTVSLKTRLAAEGFGVTVTPLRDAPGVLLAVGGELPGLFGPAEPISWQIGVAAEPAPAATDYEAGTLSLKFPVGARSTREVVVTFSLDTALATARRITRGRFAAAVEETAADLSRWFAQGESPSRLRSDSLSAMAWYLFWANSAPAGGRWTHEAVTPSKRHYFRGIWLWDAAFNALLLARGGAEARALARGQLENFLDNGMADGHLPREIWVGAVNPGTQPPGVLTWAALAVTDATGDGTTLAADYARLSANHDWFARTRDTDGDGLAEWSGTDSGWDNSPRWDGGLVNALDLACWLQLDAALLGEMAERLARTAEAAAWRAEAEARARAIRERFFDRQDGFFYDRALSTGEPVRVKTPATFLPLYLGIATQEQADAVAAHVTEPSVFATPFALPTAAPSSSAYDPDNYWRGPVWILTNAFAIWGLERYGHRAAAAALRERTRAMMAAQEVLYEYYDSQTGQGIGAPNFTWSAAFHLLLEGRDPARW